MLPLLTINVEGHHVAVRGLNDAQDVFGQLAVRHDLVTLALSAFHAYSLQLSLSCNFTAPVTSRYEKSKNTLHLQTRDRKYTPLYGHVIESILHIAGEW